MLRIAEASLFEVPRRSSYALHFVHYITHTQRQTDHTQTHTGPPLLRIMRVFFTYAICLVQRLVSDNIYVIFVHRFTHRLPAATSHQLIRCLFPRRRLWQMENASIGLHSCTCMHRIIQSTQDSYPRVHTHCSVHVTVSSQIDVIF